MQGSHRTPCSCPWSDWNKVKSCASDQVVSYADLPEAKDASILSKIAVLKLNGGLGTTMGMGGAPKSAIEVREGMTFLDLSVRQIEVSCERDCNAIRGSPRFST